MAPGHRLLLLPCLLPALAGCLDGGGQAAGAQLAQQQAVARGKAAVKRYGCSACHTIPGVAGPAGKVGPPLARIARRAYIAGVLPNTAGAMVRWLQNPPAVAPRTAMPDMGISEAEASDIAAFLYTLD